MTSKIFVGDSDDIAQVPKKIYVGVNNVAKEVKRAYVGVSGIAKQIWPPVYIPDQYQQVEYILNSGGTQYINTGVDPDSNTRFLAEYEPTNFYQNEYVFGAVASAGGMWLEIRSGRQELYFASSPTGVYSYCSIDTRYIVDINRSGGNSYINNTLVLSSVKTFAQIGKTFYLFKCNENGTAKPATNSNTIRLYHFRSFQNGTIIRDMYPCYRKSDTVIGMYDTVNNTFYTNAGTGIFYKGPDI